MIKPEVVGALDTGDGKTVAVLNAEPPVEPPAVVLKAEPVPAMLGNALLLWVCGWKKFIELSIDTWFKGAIFKKSPKSDGILKAST